MTETAQRLAPRPAGDDRPSAAPRATRRRHVSSATCRLLAGRAAELGVTLTAFYLVVIVVAGASSIALLAWPEQSGQYFSWDLGAPPAAATIGGLYLASVVVFAVALTRPRSETRSLNDGVLALAVPTLWLTFGHRDVFDWSRPQAIAWVILFLSAPISIAVDRRLETRADMSQQARPAVRISLAIVAVAGGVLAVALWFGPSRAVISAHGPVPLVGLTGRYLGAWCAFAAASAACAARRNRTSDARLVAVLLGSVSLGVLTAAARTAAELGPNALVVVLATVAVGVVAVALHRGAGPPTVLDSTAAGAAVEGMICHEVEPTTRTRTRTRTS